MKTILLKPYDLLESRTFRFLFVFGGAAFGLLFLWIFEPYGIYTLTIREKTLAVGLYVGTGMLLTYIQFFPMQKVIIRNYTVLVTILWILLSFVLVGTSSSLINSYLYNDGRYHLAAFLVFQGIILSINIIPVSAFVLLHYNLTLRKRLSKAMRVNETLQSKETTSKADTPEVVLHSENKKEGMSVPLDLLLYIRSVDNYIELSYIDEEGIAKKTLLRYSLAGVEADNKEIPELFRCHKSYIVNRQKIESVSGNAAGYKLRIRDQNEFIPVSRKWNKNLESLLLS